jgi:ribonuclease P protein component
MRKSLTRKERLKKGSEIAGVFKSPDSVKNSCFKIFYCRNKLNWNRIAVTFKRGYGNSVERNRTKRFVKEIYRNNKYKISDGHDLIFLVFKKDISYKEIEKSFISLCKNAGLINDTEETA